MSFFPAGHFTGGGAVQPTAPTGALQITIIWYARESSSALQQCVSLLVLCADAKTQAQHRTLQETTTAEAGNEKWQPDSQDNVAVSLTMSEGRTDHYFDDGTYGMENSGTCRWHTTAPLVGDGNTPLQLKRAARHPITDGKSLLIPDDQDINPLPL
ncbi:hypothetical protein GUJ93_ZPchr0007g3615 [Zizania palustris]|uniref:Uncharacterized protein n=1 Tax=Zizania palustris TaxID=103762 RepID=A0A8J5W4A7_ZIZPA|nr:hypothetical protein GUJ93_ZPchr0007g3615 [Zizania palustris]